MHVIAAKAVAFKLALEPEFREDQRRTVENAQVLAATLAEHGAKLVSGGTDNHLMLVDVTPLGVTGKEAEHLLDEVGITVNKNAIPFDPLPPNTASGIRVGSPAVTTRGFGPAEMRRVGELIVRTISRPRRPCRPRSGAAEVARHLRPLPGARTSLTASWRSAGLQLQVIDRRGPVHRRCVRRRGHPELPADARGHPRSRARVGAIDEPDSARRVHRAPVARLGGLAVGTTFVVVGIGAIAARPRGHARRAAHHPGVAPHRRRRDHRPVRGGQRSPSCWASSTTAGRSGPAGSSWASCCWRASRSRRHHVRPDRQPVPVPGRRRSVRRDLDLTFRALQFTVGGYGHPAGARPAHDPLDRGHDQLHQLDRRPRRPVHGRLAHRGRDPGHHLHHGRPRRAAVALLCAVLAGSLAGFLPWNFHPARVFIGTAGVMVVGYVAGRAVHPGHRPRSRSRCWSWACPSSTPSGSSSGASPRAPRRSRPTGATSTTACWTLASPIAGRCCSSMPSLSAWASAACCCRRRARGRCTPSWASSSPVAGPVPAHPPHAPLAGRRELPGRVRGPSGRGRPGDP